MNQLLLLTCTNKRIKYINNIGIEKISEIPTNMVVPVPVSVPKKIEKEF